MVVHSSWYFGAARGQGKDAVSKLSCKPADGVKQYFTETYGEDVCSRAEYIIGL